MSTLILLRHGQSTWNLENTFTGWVDVDLTPKGVEEARAGGAEMLAEGLLPDVVHTSLQKRAIRTANLALEVCDRLWIPVRRSWRLNERHYGALQGLDKTATREKYGDEKFQLWRRSYDVPPPPLPADDPTHPRFDPRYVDVDPADLPATECLKDVVARMLPYWDDAIVPDLRAGQLVLVAAHGNSLRALLMHLDRLTEDEIVTTNVPTGVPRVYELSDDLTVNSVRYLGDPAAIEAAIAGVASQGSR